MTKAKTIFTCSECGGAQAKWAGRCTGCSAWNTLIEGAEAPAGTGSSRFSNWSGAASEVARLSQVQSVEVLRIDAGLPELNRVPGSSPVRGFFGSNRGRPRNPLEISQLSMRHPCPSSGKLPG